MSDVLLEKINKIERMITELNAKIDNFWDMRIQQKKKGESQKNPWGNQKRRIC